jgi:hypothetical protein
LNKTETVVSFICVMWKSERGSFVIEFLKRQILHLLDVTHLLPLVVGLNERGLLQTEEIVSAIWADILAKAPPPPLSRTRRLKNPGEREGHTAKPDNSPPGFMARGEQTRSRLGRSHSVHYTAFFWFLPEILARFPWIAPTPGAVSRFVREAGFAKAVFPFMRDFWLTKAGREITDAEIELLRANDWKRFREMRRFRRSTDPTIGTMLEAIDADDVSAFQDSIPGMALDPNMKVLADPFCFTYASTEKQSREIEDSALARAQRDPYTLSVLAYAAQRGAVKIVKHLLLNGASVSGEEVLGGIVGDCPEIVRLFDDQCPLFQSRVEQIRLPRPFEHPDDAQGRGVSSEERLIQDWIGRALSVCRPGICRWMVESKLSDPKASFASIRNSLAVVLASNNIEAWTTFLDQRGDVVWLLTTRAREIEASLACGHVTVFAFVKDLTAAAHIDELFQVRSGFHRDESPLISAAKSGSLSIVESIWDAMSTASDARIVCSVLDTRIVCSAIANAFTNGHADVAAFLLSKVTVADVRARIVDILERGARRGTAEVAEL